jgi:hypothetical protein
LPRLLSKAYQLAAAGGRKSPRLALRFLLLEPSDDPDDHARCCEHCRCLGPEFGTLSRVDLTAAAREATDARLDVLIACSFNFDAHASELTRLGPLPILKAKMNPDLHMAEELKNTGKGNLFVVFGEPDIDILDQGDETIIVKVNGIDVFDPNTGQIPVHGDSRVSAIDGFHLRLCCPQHGPRDCLRLGRHWSASGVRP